MNLIKPILIATSLLLVACGSESEGEFEGKFISENVPGSYTVSFPDGDAPYIFNEDLTGSVSFPCENCDETFTWSVDDEGRLLLILTGGDSNSGLEGDRYTLISGSETNGQVQLDRDLDNDGTFEMIDAERASFIKIVE